MLQRILSTIARHRMFEPGARVGVAVSGGADSICLLHALHELAPRWGLRLWVLHLNHNLRGEESAGDARFAGELAASLGLPFVVEETRLEGAGENLEQAARQARTEFFGRARRELALDRVATGHTRSDQAETVLFRLLRGSGTAGLAAIRPVTAEGLVRPLLDISREDVREYLAERGIGWREDATNLSLAFARNRIRLELLPRLKAEWNPALEQALAQTAELASEEESFWEGEMERRFAGVFRREGEFLIGSLDALDGLPRAVKRRLIRRAVEAVRGDLRQIEFGHVEQLLALSESPEGSGRFVGPGVDVIRSFSWMRFGPPGVENINNRNYRFDVKLPVEVQIPGSRLVLSLQRIRKQDRPADRAYNEDSGGELDGGLLTGPLAIRNWRPGDQFQPVGRQTPQKIKTLFQDSRIPLWDRRKWPILTCGSQIVWTSRFGVAEGFAAGTGTQEILRVEERLQPES